MTYCLKCGEQGRPQRAVGVDEDGEAACAAHSVKAEILPDQPATIEQEKNDMANEAKVCACGCGTALPEGYKRSHLRGHASGNGNGKVNGKALALAHNSPALANRGLVTLHLPAAKVEKLLGLLLQ